MKFKALRFKEQPEEFVHLVEENGVLKVFTSSLPNPQPETASIELMKKYYSDKVILTWEDFELIEFTITEKNTIGADIRNKLSPSLNLISLVRIYMEEMDSEKRGKLRYHIEKEMDNAERAIQYIAKLL